MKYFYWDDYKNEKLKKERGISFEIIVSQIEMGFLLDVIEHPNKLKYGNQNILVIEYNLYVYLVPFTEDDNKLYLKTIIPSRKFTKKYLGE